MNVIARVLVSCFIALWVPVAAGAEPDPAAVAKLFAAWNKPDTPGVSLAVVRAGKIAYSRGFGLANLEYGVPNTPSTVFHAASVSKQFTAFAIHLLVQDGKLSLDDEVRKYVPELQVPGPAITVRHLLHHTSGLRDQWSLLMLAGLRLDDVITENDILGLLWRQNALNFAPGEEELYSNSGYTLLALIVKRVSGKTLGAFAQERIFVPLGMKNTHFHDSYGALVKGRAYSYDRSGDAWRYVALSYSNVGATSLFTTVDDLARWDRNFYDARVGGAPVLAAMLKPGRLNNGREISYASGLAIGRYRGLPVVEHGGVDAGYRSHILRFPEQQLSVLLLGNASDLITGELARRVADLYLDGAEPARGFPAEVELQAADLAPYLGEFELRPGFMLNFTAQNNRLMVQATGQRRFEMFASAKDRFFVKDFDAAVTFGAPAAGGAAATAMWQQGGRDLPLKRAVHYIPSIDSMQACAGEFYSQELRTLYRVTLQDGRLMVRYPRGQLELKPVSSDAFSAGFPVGTVVFKRNDANACNGFAVTTGRVRNLQFVRVKLTGTD